MVHDGIRKVVIEYAEQAEVTLRRASQLSSKAQIQMENTSYQLTTTLPQQLNTIEIYKESLVIQHELVGKVVDNYKKQVERSSLLQLEQQYHQVFVPALTNLQEMIRQLQETSVPRYLLNEKAVNLEYKNLADFISLDEILKFQKNIEIYKNNNFKVLQYFQNKLQLLIYDPVKQFNKKYNKLLKKLEELIPIQLELKPAQLNSGGIIGVILRENASLEKEVLSLLEMLTKHYDQCIHGVKLIDSQNSSSFNFEVLKQDSRELPDVLKELTVVCDMILKNEDRAEKILGHELPKVEAIIDNMKLQLQLYRDFKTNNLSQLISLLSIIEKQLLTTTLNELENDCTPIEQYSRILNQLYYHYSQTLRIYQSEYLQELHREQYEYPRLFLSKISKFLTEELVELQQQELIKRQKWMKDFGEFIPQEFKSPEALGVPIVLQIETQGMEDLQSDIIDGHLKISKNEKLLTDLIDKMNKKSFE